MVEVPPAPAEAPERATAQVSRGGAGAELESRLGGVGGWGEGPRCFGYTDFFVLFSFRGFFSCFFLSLLLFFLLSFVFFSVYVFLCSLFYFHCFLFSF